ncbi:acid protease [Lyophyllum atratum]|nr:acid protease [Lyophyllum atratum]
MSRFVINAIPFETRITYDARQILARDKARAQKLLAGFHPHGPAAFHSKKTSPQANGSDVLEDTIDVTDAGIAYTIPVKIGDPPTTFSVLLDIGSSNTWVGADRDYQPTHTSSDSGKTINITYGSGTFIGTEYTDKVTLGGNLVVTDQRIGVASSARGFSGVDGILGIGPVDLTTEAKAAGPRQSPVTENLFNSGVVPTAAIGMSYNPNPKNVANGEITFGATDTAKFTGSINYVPITSITPADQYWGVDQDLVYGDDMQLLASSAGIVDTGTTLCLLASDVFKSYRRATGAEEDDATGLLTVTEAQFAKMESLFFTIGSETYELTPNAQIWPRKLNSTIGGEEGKIYLITADMGTSSGAGLDFINGFAFLQRFYTVFDTTNSRVGFARTKFTNAEIN